MTLIDRNTVVVGIQPRMTLQAFQAVLQAAGSPATGEAAEMYAAIVSESIEPAFMLAVFWEESQFATDPKSMVVRHDTKNLGNTRSSRIGVRTIVPTERGNFVKYDSWGLGARDAARRLTDPYFAYAMAGANTIGEIIPIWAPGTDGNDPAGYTQTVISLINQWVGNTEGPMFDLNNIPFKQSPNYNPGGNSCLKVIIHSTEGSYSSSVGWLLSTASQASAHYVINEDGSQCTQLVKDENIAWHAGNMAYNQICIGIEHSWFSDGRNGPPPESLYQAGAKLTAQLCKKHGIVPNRGNILAHGQVPPPNDHTDPGPRWDWGKFMAYVTQAFNGGDSTPVTLPYGVTVDSVGALIFPNKGFNVLLNFGFKDAFLTLFGNVAQGDLSNAIMRGVKIFGLPIAPEVADDTGSSQDFELCEFRFNKNEAEGWKVRLYRDRKAA